MPPLETYAILDAAKVTNLPEMLEASGLEHCGLFKGAAHGEMKDVAPWTARLQEAAAFTRNLFTRSDAHWHLRDANPGIYLRSRPALDAVRAHFRKFTRARDSTGKWYYFRFWEAPHLEGLLENGHSETIRRLLGAKDLLTCDPHAGAAVFHPQPSPKPAVTEAFYLREADVAARSEVSSRQFARRLAKWLVSSYGRGGPADETAAFSISGVRQARNVLSLGDERSVADDVAARWILGCPAETRYDLTPGPDLSGRVQRAHSNAAPTRGPALKSNG